MRDEKGEIESEGLREERNQGNDLDDDSAVKERADPTERARELAREREREIERERGGQRSGY